MITGVNAKEMFTITRRISSEHSAYIQRIQQFWYSGKLV